MEANPFHFSLANVPNIAYIYNIYIYIIHKGIIGPARVIHSTYDVYDSV